MAHTFHNSNHKTYRKNQPIRIKNTKEFSVLLADSYVLWLLLRKVCAMVVRTSADQISNKITVTLRRELKPMTQSGYYFRFMYYNEIEIAINLSIRQV